MELMIKSNLLDKYYHLFTDNIYTKLPLAEALINRDTFLTGMMGVKHERFIHVLQADLGVAKPQAETPQAAESDNHELVHLPGRVTRVYTICGKSLNAFLSSSIFGVL
ncbi:hypothetical protein J6590_012463 [Homalodisca vitripennis]|nr:hypothetical protein J6590_012463 [Homalodisca vitripennis]